MKNSTRNRIKILQVAGYLLISINTPVRCVQFYELILYITRYPIILQNNNYEN